MVSVVMVQRFDEGDTVTPTHRLYDRNAPTLYRADHGEVGEVWAVAYHLGETLVTVSFGLCVVVANQRCFEAV